jgi:hypothetical protein
MPVGQTRCMDSTQGADGFVNLVLSESEAVVLFATRPAFSPILAGTEPVRLLVHDEHLEDLWRSPADPLDGARDLIQTAWSSAPAQRSHSGSFRLPTGSGADR